MKLVKTTKSNIEAVLHEAADILNSGGVIAYPTETFYGLGAKYDLENALGRIYAVKHRPLEKAMPLIISSRELLSSLVISINATAESLMDRFWPGPLTLILRAKGTLSQFITAGTGNVAVRIPGESFALSLAGTAGYAVTATSANPSGLTPANDAETVLRYFGDSVDFIIDAGHTPGGLPSTIVDATGETIEILREGIIKTASVMSVIHKPSPSD